MSKRKTADERREQILNAGLHLARKHGYQNVTREQIADRLGMKSSVLHHYFGTMTKYRRALVRCAITRNDVTVLGQALAAGDRHAKRAPEALRRRAARAIAAV